MSVTIQKATDLAAMDLNGRSDPYVVISVGQNQQRTTVKGRTLDPVLTDNYLSHNYLSHNYLSHNYLSHNYLSHDYLSHNYLSHNYLGHNYLSHNFALLPDLGRELLV